MSKNPIIGRFAPSPTGKLHLGSLTTAVASYCHIKSLGGKWLVRIEDVDFERCKPAYSASILHDLENLGLYSDDCILYQSKRTAIYNEFLADKLAKFSYICTCSRKQLSEYYQQSQKNTAKIYARLHQTQGLNTADIYPRICLKKQPLTNIKGSKTRLILPDSWVGFYDGIQGILWDNPALSLGDVVVKRQNGMINYILACSIDDGLQNITHVMRGLDIMPMTAAQIKILDLCKLPVPSYFYHLPLLHNFDGQKLSKQNLATPIDTQSPLKSRMLLLDALKRLKQPVTDDLLDGSVDEILAFAIKHWNHKPLQQTSTLGIA